MTNDWKGLAAELKSFDAPDAAGPSLTAAPDADRVTTPAPAPGRRRAKERFADTHRLVGIYFPRELDAEFRRAADNADVSNSEFVVLAVRAYLRSH